MYSNSSCYVKTTYPRLYPSHSIAMATFDYYKIFGSSAMPRYRTRSERWCKIWKKIRKVSCASPLCKAYLESKEVKFGKGVMMLHSTVTSKGQTTIPGEIRLALNIKAGARLKYEVEGDHLIVRVHPGAQSLRGALASDKGLGLSFREIREAAAKDARQLKGKR